VSKISTEYLVPSSRDSRTVIPTERSERGIPMPELHQLQGNEIPRFTRNDNSLY